MLEFVSNILKTPQKFLSDYKYIAKLSKIKFYNMITASLILNIIVLIPVCFTLIMNFEEMQKTAGIFTPARGILLAIYLTILLASAFLLFFMDTKLAFALFVMQIVYKLISPVTVKTIKNPIVICNLLIAVFHLVTIYTMLKADAIHFDFLPS
jgi:hypothetical protein